MWCPRRARLAAKVTVARSHTWTCDIRCAPRSRGFDRHRSEQCLRSDYRAICPLSTHNGHSEFGFVGRGVQITRHHSRDTEFAVLQPVTSDIAAHRMELEANEASAANREPAGD